MTKSFLRSLFVISMVLPHFHGFGGTYVFWEKGFPSVENGGITHATLEAALSPLHPRFIGLVDLRKGTLLEDGDLLVLPYGSAFPADAWETIRRHVDRGDLLILGGRPFFSPVYRDSTRWRTDSPTNAFSRAVGIEHSYAAPRHGPWMFEWSEDAVFFQGNGPTTNRVFVNAGRGGRYRGLGYFVDSLGFRRAAPVVADDRVGRGQNPHRRVYLSFDANPSFWESNDGIGLIRRAALYASQGGVRLWLDLQYLTVNPGDPVTGAIDLVRRRRPARLRIDILSQMSVLESQWVICDSSMHAGFSFAVPRDTRGPITVRATLLSGDTLLERYISGVTMRDTALIHAGGRLGAGRDYFRLDGKPYLMVGANYFSTDYYTRGFFVGGSIGGNAWIWERDFAEMERQGFTAVRTGLWLNHERYLDVVSGAADERLLRAIEAFLAAAGRHHMQVIFTFFAFNPQLTLGEGGEHDGEQPTGPNAYLNPAALEAEGAYVRAIASRFRDVPFLSFDLINEPSVTNGRRLWKGNSPNGDPDELAAWRHWLQNRYGRVPDLARAWHTTPAEVGSFERIALPGFTDLESARSGNAKLVRAVDYNLFAQEVFRSWVDAMIRILRSAGARQAVTVGQDEGGVTDRVLNQFWAESAVDFTVNHTWWRDDALLWDSFAAKTPDKPNLIGETGPQPVWAMDGSWRWDEVQGMGLEERKLVLAFACANAGILHWDWSRDEDFSLLRRDGSHKQWMNAVRGIARFAHEAQTYATDAIRPEVALVLPQSLQLSTFGGWGLAAQQNAVRALYYYARGVAVAAGEYQLARTPATKLIIVPAPWVMHQDAWDLLMNRVRSGATLLISGRVDADEFWRPVSGRTEMWKSEYAAGPLATREVGVTWPEGDARLSYSGDRTTYAERGFLRGGATFVEVPLGSGRILYFAPPLELADQTGEIGRIYQYAMKRAGVADVYNTDCSDPGIAICPTRLPEATLYAITSESSKNVPVAFHDALSGTDIQIMVPSGRSALLVVRKDGKIVAEYKPVDD